MSQLPVQNTFYSSKSKSMNSKAVVNSLEVNTPCCTPHYNLIGLADGSWIWITDWLDGAFINVKPVIDSISLYRPQLSPYLHRASHSSQTLLILFALVYYNLHLRSRSQITIQCIHSSSSSQPILISQTSLLDCWCRWNGKYFTAPEDWRLKSNPNFIWLWPNHDPCPVELKNVVETILTLSVIQFVFQIGNSWQN